MFIEASLDLKEESLMAVCIATPHIERISSPCKRENPKVVQLTLNQPMSDAEFLTRKNNIIEDIVGVLASAMLEPDNWIEFKRIVESSRLGEPDLVALKYTRDESIIIAAILEEVLHVFWVTESSKRKDPILWGDDDHARAQWF